MPPFQSLLYTALIWVTMVSVSAADSFQIYFPARSSNSLWIVEAKETDAGLSLTQSEKIDVGFSPATIVAHPDKPLLYISANGGDAGQVPGAVITLDESGAYQNHHPVTLENGYSYLSLDRSNRFLMGAYYRGGNVDVYRLGDDGSVGDRVAALDEGRPNAHCVLPSPDNRFVYIPYVKDTNGLFQYEFDPKTGSLTALDPKNANPPEGTGPRHLAYHPTLPMLYFSNEQGLGVSVYERKASGQLELRQVCDSMPPLPDEKGVSASDIALATTPEGHFLFTGIRGNDRVPNAIARYRILEDGTTEYLGMTPADETPWGLTLSPGGRYLLVTAFKGATLTAFSMGPDGELSNAASLPIDPQVSDLVTR